jgi:hypothetical protein
MTEPLRLAYPLSSSYKIPRCLCVIEEIDLQKVRKTHLAPCALSSSTREHSQAHTESAVDSDHGAGDVGRIVV